MDIWTSYHGVNLWREAGGTAYGYVTTHMEIDADGAPNAYHPDNTGLDALANAGYPNGGWTSVLAVDPHRPGHPYVQPPGSPFAGYFVSRTSLQDTTLPDIDTARYVDASQVPYLVFPGAFHKLAGTGTTGDLVVCKALDSGLTCAAIVADIGPRDAPLGEVSIALAARLGGRHPNPRTGAGKPHGPVKYVVFPGSRGKPAWPLTPTELDRRAHERLEAAGGWARFDAIPAH